MYGFVGVMILGLVRSDCLSNSTLTSLGFTPVAPYTPASNNTYCTGAVQNQQFCVNATQIPSVASASRSYAWQLETANFTAALSNATLAFASFQSLCTNTVNSTNVGRRLNGVTITSAMVSNCASLNTTGNTFINILGSSSTSTIASNCQTTVSTIMNGSYCLFATSLATTYTTSALQVNVTSSVPTAAVSSCLPYIFGACYMNEVATLLDQFTQTTTANAALTTTCGPSSVLANCINNNTSCSSVAPGLFTQLFTPTGSNIGNAMSKTVGQSISTTQSYTLVRRLLAAAVTAVSSSFIVGTSGGGFDVINTSTGLNTTTTGSSSSGSFFGLSFLFALIALFLN